MAILPELLISAAVLQNVLVDKNGLPLSAGVVTLYHDNSRTTLKNWYYQSGTPGNYAWIPLPNPMILSAAGTTVDNNGNDIDPFYYPWFVDNMGNIVHDPYFITVYDSNGELQFTRAFFPFNGDELNPGPPTQNIFTLENLVTNNRFWRNIGSVNAGTIVNPSTPLPFNNGIGYIQSGNFGQAYNSSGNYYYLTLAPSQNDGFSMPDFNYIKNAQGGAESISFVKFSPSTTPILGGDVMPEFYVEHICGSQDSGVSIKVYQFPISLHLDTLAGQTASVSIQARSNTGATQLTLALYQFQGTGNTSFQSIPTIFPLTTTWEKWTANIQFPSNLNVVNSLTGDDAWYLQIGMPVDSSFTIDFTLPSLYLNPLEEIPTNSFESYDQIDSIISKPRTGDIRTSINQFYPYGWLPMNGGTIGNNTTDMPAYTPTARNNIDTWSLFNLIWTLFKAYNIGVVNPIAQMYDATGAMIAYGATPAVDWNAFHSLALTRSMGQVMLGTVPITAILAPYRITYNSAPDTITTTASVAGVFFNGMPVYIMGPTIPAGLALNTIYYVAAFNGTTNFALSTNFANAIASPPITIPIGTTTGGTAIILSALAGTTEGEYSHIQTLSELLQHTHNPLSPTTSFLNSGPIPGTSINPNGAPPSITYLEPTTGGVTGRSGIAPTPTNKTQPGTFNNIYIKL